MQRPVKVRLTYVSKTGSVVDPETVDVDWKQKTVDFHRMKTDTAEAVTEDAAATDDDTDAEVDVLEPPEGESQDKYFYSDLLDGNYRLSEKC